MPTKIARNIAAAARLDVMRISDMERMARPGWTLATLEKVAKALGVTISELTKEA